MLNLRSSSTAAPPRADVFALCLMRLMFFSSGSFTSKPLGAADLLIDDVLDNTASCLLLSGKCSCFSVSLISGTDHVTSKLQSTSLSWLNEALCNGCTCDGVTAPSGGRFQLISVGSDTLAGNQH